MKGPVLTIPNLVSLSRVPLGLAACLFVLKKLPMPALAAIALAIASDFIDGMVARRTGSVSDWGKIFDPLADKIAIGAFMATLAIAGAVPLWFLVLFLARDLLIASGGLLLTRVTGSPPSSNIWGKLASLTMSLYLTAAAVGHMLETNLWPDGLTAWGLDPSGLLALGFVLTSLIVYCSESVRTLRRG